MRSEILCLGRDRAGMEQVSTELIGSGWSVRQLADPQEVFPILMKEDPVGLVVLHGDSVDARQLLPKWRAFNANVPFFVLTYDDRDALAAYLANQDRTYVYDIGAGSHWGEVVRLLRDAAAERRHGVDSIDGHLWSILEDTVDWIWKTDEEDRITYSSPGTERLFGHASAELIGRRVSELVPSIDQEDLEEAWAAAVQRLEPLRDYHLKVLASDGRVVGLSLRASPVCTHDGRFIGMVCVCMDETQRLAAFEMAVAEEENYRSLLESLPDPVVVIEPDGIISMINKAAVDFFGAVDEDLLGLNIFTLVREDERGVAQRNAQRVLDGEMLEGTRLYHLLGVDGSEKLGEVRSSLQRDEKGHPLRLALIFRDVTERFRLESELEMSRAKHQNIMDSVPAVAFELDQYLCFTYVGPNADKIWGFPSEAVLGTSPFDYLELGEKVRAISALENTIQQRLPFDGLMIKVKRPDGRVDHLEIGGRPYYDRNNVYQGYHGVARDVTRRVEAENSLRHLEDMYRMVASNINDSVWTCDMHHRINYVSPSMRRNLLMKENDDIHEVLPRVIDAESMKRMGEGIDSVLSEKFRREGRQSVTIEVCVQGPDSEQHWLEQNLSLLKDADGKVMGVLGVGRDITERKQLEMKLTKAERTAWELFDRGPDAMYLVDPATDPPSFLLANDRAVRDTGFQLDELRGKPVQELVVDMTPADFQRIMAELQTKESISEERLQRRKDGTMYEVQGNMSIVTLDDKVMVLAQVRDISHLTKNQRLLDRRNRELVLMNRLIRSCTYVKSEDDLLRITMNLVMELGDYNVGALVMPDENDRPFIIERAGLEDSIVDYLNSDGSILTELVDYVDDGEPLFMASVSAISNRARTWGIESLTILPMVLGGEMVATMVFASTVEREIPMSDRHLMISIWYQVRETIKAIRLKEQQSDHLVPDIGYHSHQDIVFR